MLFNYLNLYMFAKKLSTRQFPTATFVSALLSWGVDAVRVGGGGVWLNLWYSYETVQLYSTVVPLWEGAR
jgi:hypothetical protein